MSNLSPFVYWISNLYFDFIFFLAILILRIILIKLIDDEGGFLAIEDDFGKNFKSKFRFTSTFMFIQKRLQFFGILEFRIFDCLLFHVSIEW